MLCRLIHSLDVHLWKDANLWKPKGQNKHLISKYCNVLTALWAYHTAACHWILVWNWGHIPAFQISMHLRTLAVSTWTIITKRQHCIAPKMMKYPPDLIFRWLLFQKFVWKHHTQTLILNHAHLQRKYYGTLCDNALTSRTLSTYETDLNAFQVFQEISPGGTGSMPNIFQGVPNSGGGGGGGGGVSNCYFL